MKVLGLITEYNPFHNGHLYHLNASKELTGCTHAVAIMSGNFLQRGEPALVHKWDRAKMAVQAGVDLVIELPTPYACATAELFAFGSISLLHAMGVVDALCFGSEYGEISLLKVIANVLFLSPPKFKIFLKNHLKKGLSFPSARTKALADYFNLDDDCNLKTSDLEVIEMIMNSPNNILAIEYMKMLKKLNASILPYTIPRIKAAYHSTKLEGSIVSATAIREHFYRKNHLQELKGTMPPSSLNILEEAFEKKLAPIFKEDFEKVILTLLRRESKESLSHYFDIREGLENKIFQCSHHCNSLTNLYHCVKSKRYTQTRFQRICMHVLLNLKKKDIIDFTSSGGPQYLRVLALNNKGREILKACKLKATLPIINKINQYVPSNEIAKKMLEIDIRATNLYALATNNEDYSTRPLDFYISPYYQVT
ncbi:nucleotidyltransferase [Clostridium formicaceticum]|uniref:tRNA(Met) cytidine acetate ligase n=1 Tax=Clostridium formicaceticum TaxID=1497 RepID=A0AAC9WGJ6_9CLOT|nr:nucleotidyltransferase [Clostridium formicaceticum]AOY77357.1 hypothetical protein BJL90_16755 [Clostridium formicaceticum]ARE87901.1 hypothetical protein CLFO_23010 [Clostridium formicaceticum]